MDFNANEQQKTENTQNESVLDERLQTRQYVAITFLFTALAALLTFLLTYVFLTSSHREEKDTMYSQLVGQMNQQLSEAIKPYQEFDSVIQMYNSLPAELRNIAMYEKLAEIDLYYRTHYAGEINADDLVYMVANGYIVGAGDRFGGYYTADEFKTIMSDVDGNTVGIGVYVTADMEIDGIRISYVMKDGPANKVGLLPGDIITHVDGQAVAELGYYTALELVKGEIGTEVVVTVLRQGKELTKTLVRDRINVESVIYTKHETDQSVGIIRVIEFSNSTSQQFIDAVKTAINEGCTNIVYDLRGNPGGTLTSVVEMLDFLLPQGKIVTVRYAGAGEVDVYYSDTEGEELSNYVENKDIKMAILVNGATASAAELFTSTLSDYGVATVVGTKTYGKGCGQSIIQLSDGTGLAFTTFMYDPPVRPNYNGIGITPDVIQEMSEEASQKNIFELSHNEDDQLKAALEALKK